MDNNVHWRRRGRGEACTLALATTGGGRACVDREGHPGAEGVAVECGGDGTAATAAAFASDTRCVYSRRKRRSCEQHWHRHPRVGRDVGPGVGQQLLPQHRNRRRAVDQARRRYVGGKEGSKIKQVLLPQHGDGQSSVARPLLQAWYDGREERRQCALLPTPAYT